jgi:hypothetical protein
MPLLTLILSSGTGCGSHLPLSIFDPAPELPLLALAKPDPNVGVFLPLELEYPYPYRLRFIERLK